MVEVVLRDIAAAQYIEGKHRLNFVKCNLWYYYSIRYLHSIKWK